MASGWDMMAPISLVENDNEQLSVNQEAIETLEKISQPVVVVAIVGLYRTGKSYLMNRLAGQKHGFPLGSTVQSKTKGIWMWCVPHPFKSDHTLVLLDTEGLGDVEKGDSKNDSWIFSLAVLLCSTFIYNSMSTINNQALEHLHYVTELTKLIKAKSSPSPDGEEDCTEFVTFFPDFIWAVRDFTLELKLNGHPITEDQYLENALKLTKGKNMKVQTSNLCKECIREFFPTRKCFVFDRPTNDKELLADIENVSEYQLNPKFQEQIKKFCSYIFTNAKTKTLREGVLVTGNWLVKLVVIYVDTINNGAVPCLENAVTSLAHLENSAAVQKAADHYSEKMTQQLSLPTDTFQELLEVHAACEKEAIAIFMERSFKDENQEFQKNLVEIIKNKKEDFVLQNEEASVKYCQVKLDEISKTLMESISAGIFSVPGGYELYRKAKERFEQDYHQVPRKGVKANEVLQSFLQSQAALEKSILQADKALTDGEKTVAEERARNEIAEKERELLKQKLQEQQQEMEAQKKSFQENIAQLTEKLEKEKENLLREMNMMLEHKMKESLLGCQVTMASGPNMMDPICLVENKNAQLSVNQKALQILENISQPVVVVAIVGLYRTGKSYLMNRLAGQNHGFPLGSTVQSKTKGIWMWCVPHPSKSEHILVLLDTEGLGDVEKGDSKNDSWIFALAVLLSSTFVYNSMNTINNDALEKLHYVTELTELIRAKSSPKMDGVRDSVEFASFFPDFIWTVRDFTLELKLNDDPITEDEYLENALKLIKGSHPNVKKANLPRECIRHFFPKRKCFVFDRPVNDRELLAHLDEVLESQLDPKFKEQSDTFCSYIFTHARTKILREGVKVTGKRLGTLVVTYVDAINSGGIPCLENAVTTLAHLENSAAMQKAADYYSEQMTQRLNLPTDTLQELLEVHTACEREATVVFMNQSFKDENQDFQKKLLEIIKNKKEGFLQQNEEASAKYCQTKLDQISKTLKESISAGSFSVPGGHKLYRKAMERLQQDYCHVPRKGVKTNEVLQNFLQSQVAIEISILQSDKALTDAAKAIAEKQARKEATERERELLIQKQYEQQQQMEAQDRSLRENIAQLREKLERERENFEKEKERLLEHTLKAQNDLLTEGFSRKAEEMKAEIKHLRNIIEKSKKDKASWISKTLDGLATEATAILSLPAKVIGWGLKGLSSLFK
uniref:GB1/RHD3-type G domain-containing protein n=3 Tax=Bos TaxID=9903 RepID=E1B824_BOVIN